MEKIPLIGSERILLHCSGDLVEEIPLIIGSERILLHCSGDLVEEIPSSLDQSGSCYIVQVTLWKRSPHHWIRADPVTLFR